MLHDLVKRVNIYPDDVLEVQLNFTDELEELEKEITKDGTGQESGVLYACSA